MQVRWRDEVLAQEMSGVWMSDFINSGPHYYTSKYLKDCMAELDRNLGDDAHKVQQMFTDDPSFLPRIFSEVSVMVPNMLKEAHTALKSVFSTMNLHGKTLTPALDFLSFEPISQWGVVARRLAEYRGKWMTPLADAVENERKRLLGERDFSMSTEENLDRSGIFGDDFYRLTSSKRYDIESSYSGQGEAFGKILHDINLVQWSQMTLDELAIVTKTVQEKFARLSAETEQKIIQWKKMASE